MEAEQKAKEKAVDAKNKMEEARNEKIKKKEEDKLIKEQKARDKLKEIANIKEVSTRKAQEDAAIDAAESARSRTPPDSPNITKARIKIRTPTQTKKASQIKKEED